MQALHEQYSNGRISCRRTRMFRLTNSRRYEISTATSCRRRRYPSTLWTAAAASSALCPSCLGGVICRTEACLSGASEQDRAVICSHKSS